jgi:hypothetical protein
MRKLLLILFCFISLFLNAQNFMNICGPGLSLYINRTGNFRAFRQDSAYRVTGKFMIERRDTINQQDQNDSIFISYRTIRSMMNGCYDTTNGSLLGRRVYKRGDGTFWFLNRYHDTITLKALAGLNSSWKFCDITDSTWIEARVTDIIIDTVLGLTDPTKVITFQAKDHLGNNITHFLNQQTMKLSQHYGITKTFDIYFVPSVEITDSSVYYLAGKSHPVLGVQNLTWQDVYNFDVGDEFHHYTYYTGEGGPITKSMQRVISKQDFGNDSVKYIMDNCGVTLYYNLDERVHDTITLSYNFHTMGNVSLQALPDAFLPGGWRAPNYTRYSSYGRYQAQAYDTFRYGRSYSCWNDAFEPDHTISDYAEGLGETYYFWQQWYNWPVEMTNELVYCKKGSVSYGTPLAPNCDVLLKINEQREKEIKISVNPNPVDTRAEVILANTGQSVLYYFLTNSYSQQVLSGEVISNSFILDRRSLAAGIYILTISDKNNNLLGRKKILFE